MRSLSGIPKNKADRERFLFYINDLCGKVELMLIDILNKSDRMPLQGVHLYEEYLYYDGPIIFSMFNSCGRFFLATAVTRDPWEWVVTPIDIVTLHLYSRGKIDLLEAMYCYKHRHAQIVKEDGSASSVYLYELEDKYLPKSGLFCKSN